MAAERTSAASSSASLSIEVARPPRPAYVGFLFSSSSARTRSISRSSSMTRCSEAVRLELRPDFSAVSWLIRWSTAALS